MKKYETIEQFVNSLYLQAQFDKSERTRRDIGIFYIYSKRYGEGVIMGVGYYREPKLFYLHSTFKDRCEQFDHLLLEELAGSVIPLLAEKFGIDENKIAPI